MFEGVPTGEATERRLGLIEPAGEVGLGAAASLTRLPCPYVW